MSENGFQLSSAKAEVIRNTPLTGAGEIFTGGVKRQKQSKEIIDWPQLKD